MTLPGAPTRRGPRPIAARSPSTVRRRLGQAERDLAAAIAARDKLAKEMASTNAHWELSTLGEQLAALRPRSPPPRKRGWLSPPKPKTLGLTPLIGSRMRQHPPVGRRASAAAESANAR